MEDDLISSLTRQVKEEVVENYLTERSLIELQTEDFQKQAQAAGQMAVKTGRRLSRMAYLMIQPGMVEKLTALLHIHPDSFWSGCLQKRLVQGTRYIKVRALTDKGKFRKLVLEAYNRLDQWMEKYRKSYENLEAECRAVNSNITKFHNNFDLLALLSFLKSLDTAALERKQFLGENFTAEELASVDKKLYLPLVSFEKLDLPPPLKLPKPEAIEDRLSELANEIYGKYQDNVKRLMQ